MTQEALTLGLTTVLLPQRPGNSTVCLSTGMMKVPQWPSDPLPVSLWFKLLHSTHT